MSRKRHKAPLRVLSKTELFGRVSKIMTRKRNEAPRKVSSKTESFGRVSNIMSRKRHEAPCKVSFKTESFGRVSKIMSRKHHEAPPNFVQNGVVCSDFKNNESEATRKVLRLYQRNPDPENQFFLS